MKIAYVRVSTIEQNESRQKYALENYDIEKWFIEHASAKDTNRPQLQAMIDFAREGDIIYVHDFSRISRNTNDLLNIVMKFEEKGIKFVSTKENIDTTTPTGKLMLAMIRAINEFEGKLMLAMIGAINEFERDNMLERQREGIAIAKREGKYKGRKPIQVEDFEKHYHRYITRQVNKVELSKELKITRPTLDKLIREYKQLNNVNI